MLDEDEAGRNARDEIASRLAKFVFVRVHVFDKEGMQPEQLTEEDVFNILGDTP
jgi:DNA primase